MASDAKPIIHRGVAVLLYENEAVLEETMRAVDTSELHLERIGDRAIVGPAYELETIREALQEQGMYPKVVGKLVDLAEPEDDPSDDDESEDDQTEAPESESDDQQGG